MKNGRAPRIIRPPSCPARGGNFGDCKSAGGGFSERRLHIGPGDRVSFSRHGATVALLLRGGDKSAQVEPAT